MNAVYYCLPCQKWAVAFDAPRRDLGWMMYLMAGYTFTTTT